MLVSSSGVQLALPPVGRSATHRTDGATVRIGRNVSAASHSVQVQIAIEFHNGAQSFDRLRGWKLVVTCRAATVGRFDGWMAGDRLARFRQGPLNETSRTIGMPATSNNVIAVASHVSKNKWQSNLGPQTAPAAVIARSSRFSSKGPTRDGRQKPEISAPGEMITAALAIPSESTEEKDRADSGAKLLTIEGTSMATPFVTGAVALLLQRDPTLTPERIIQLLRSTAVKDQHTGPADWTPEYGHGKISVRQMVQGLQQLSPGQPAPATVALAQPGAAKPPKASRRRAKAPT
jgi:subtilisin family serine protease